eukprot:TRINITY_DN34549_c0_g1_i1.p1 TRINITY_DN34549_c0_g1~~TRINITY_DN34549_c0_g1_i1.p1  ORF type:complete len:353 (+),score=59.75 TRINITY_DN34549_c0_g1_i1:175-1233(+)
MLIAIVGYLSIAAASYFRDGCTVAIRGTVTNNWMNTCNNCVPGLSPVDVAMVAASSVDSSATFTVEAVSDGYIALKASNGNYVGICENCYGTNIKVLTMSYSSQNSWRTSLKPEMQPDGKFAFRFSSPEGALYLTQCVDCIPTATHSISSTITSSSTTLNDTHWGVHVLTCPPLEQSLQDGCIVSLQSHLLTYFSACKSCTESVEVPTIIDINDQTISQSSQFRVADIGGGMYSLQSWERGYVGVCDGCDGGGHVPDGTVAVHVGDPVAAWVSKFVFTDLLDGKFSVKAITDAGVDKYLAHCAGCNPSVPNVPVTVADSSSDEAKWNLLLHSCPSSTQTVRNCGKGCLKRNC